MLGLRNENDLIRLRRAAALFLGVEGGRRSRTGNRDAKTPRFPGIRAHPSVKLKTNNMSASTDYYVGVVNYLRRDGVGPSCAIAHFVTYAKPYILAV